MLQNIISIDVEGSVEGKVAIQNNNSKHSKTSPLINYILYDTFFKLVSTILKRICKIKVDIPNFP